MARRLNSSFPTSLGGKAYDTSLVLIWLEEYLRDCRHGDPMVDKLRFTVRCANFFFRRLREHGVFVAHEERLLIAAAGEGMTAA